MFYTYNVKSIWEWKINTNQEYHSAVSNAFRLYRKNGYISLYAFPAIFGETRERGNFLSMCDDTFIRAALERQTIRRERGLVND